MNKRVIKPSPAELRKIWLRKNLPLIILAIAIAIVLAAWLKPDFKRDLPVLDEPKISQAIVAYANTQMKKELLELPAGAASIKVEQVLVHELEELPGAQGNRRCITTVKGSYLLPESDNPDQRIAFRIEKMKFKLERRYPEGINVQAYTVD